MGMTRGESDKVDSSRIGQYGEEKIKKLQRAKPYISDHIIPD
jgi:transposase